MAEDLVQRRAPRAFRKRFVLAYLVLAILAGAGAGAVVLLVTGPGKEAETPWSTWRPAADLNGTGKAEQISRYVARRYRLPSGAQLVAFPIYGEPRIVDQNEQYPVRAIAVRPEEGSSEDIRGLPADDSVMYVMCGFGESCSIAGVPASRERDRLLRREALELALYSFKYIGVESVIVLLPPEPGAELAEEPPPPTAVFFERRDFRRELERPLRDTLARSDTPGVTVRVVPDDEMVRIERLTGSRVFAWGVVQGQEGSLILILNPLS